MLYINQRKYPDMPYQHNLKHGGAPADKSNISSGRLRPVLPVHGSGEHDHAQLLPGGVPADGV